MSRRRPSRLHLGRFPTILNLHQWITKTWQDFSETLTLGAVNQSMVIALTPTLILKALITFYSLNLEDHLYPLRCSPITQIINKVLIFFIIVRHQFHDNLWLQADKSVFGHKITNEGKSHYHNDDTKMYNKNIYLFCNISLVIKIMFFYITPLNVREPIFSSLSRIMNT